MGRLALPESLPLARRSGRIPAEPYPPSRFRQYNLILCCRRKKIARLAVSRL